MLTSDYILALQNSTPYGWAFMYAIRETLLAYEGTFPLMFCDVVPTELEFVANTALIPTYRQKIAFMVLDEQDSLGINLTDSSSPNFIIQKTKMDMAESAMREFLFELNTNESLLITQMRASFMPRFLANGGKVLTGVELDLVIQSTLDKC